MSAKKRLNQNALEHFTDYIHDTVEETWKNDAEADPLDKLIDMIESFEADLQTAVSEDPLEGGELDFSDDRRW